MLKGQSNIEKAQSVKKNAKQKAPTRTVHVGDKVWIYDSRKDTW